MSLFFSHVDQISFFADHQGVLVHVFEGYLDDLPEIGYSAAVVFYKIIRAVFSLEGPLGPRRHHPHDVAADNPVGRVGIDLLFRVVVPDGDLADGFVRMQRHVDGGAVNRANAGGAAVFMGDNHP